MTPEFQAVVERLEELEKQVAHLQALVTEQSDPGRAVVAESFVVKDEQGQRRAELGMVIPVGQTEAHPWLGLFDANESVRACIGTDSGGPWLELYNAKGQAVAEVREFRDGPRVSLFDEIGSTRIILAVSEGGSFAYLFSPDGKQHLRLELFSSGQASLVMQDREGEANAQAAARRPPETPKIQEPAPRVPPGRKLRAGCPSRLRVDPSALRASRRYKGSHSGSR